MHLAVLHQHGSGNPLGIVLAGCYSRRTVRSRFPAAGEIGQAVCPHIFYPSTATSVTVSENQGWGHNFTEVCR